MTTIEQAFHYIPAQQFRPPKSIIFIKILDK